MLWVGVVELGARVLEGEFKALGVDSVSRPTVCCSRSEGGRPAKPASPRPIVASQRRHLCPESVQREPQPDCAGLVLPLRKARQRLRDTLPPARLPAPQAPTAARSTRPATLLARPSAPETPPPEAERPFRSPRRRPTTTRAAKPRKPAKTTAAASKPKAAKPAPRKKAAPKPPARKSAKPKASTSTPKTRKKKPPKS